MKKCLVFILLLTLVSCSKDKMISDFESKDNFVGVVVSKTENSVLLDIKQTPDFTYDKIAVPIDAIAKDSYTDLKENDLVMVYYDGIIMESYPAQVKNIYAIKLIEKIDD